MRMMMRTIGIRREDKNEWERRVPLVPADIAELGRDFGLKTIIQPSEIRVFKDSEYEDVGAEINEDISSADAIFAVKEIPTHLLERGQTYLFFSHTIKGQPYNMEMLKRLMDLECNLIDYELIVGNQGGRLITFSRYAGIAGLIETLYAFGQKMKLKGYATPFEELKQAYQYETLAEAKTHVEEIGKMISEGGLPKELGPVTVGFLGYGNVSKGAQEMFDLLPFKAVEPSQLKKVLDENSFDNKSLVKVVFKEEDIVRPLEGSFNLQDYYNSPENFESIFHNYLTDINILINGVYWTEKYPRFVTKENLKNCKSQADGALGLQVIGDISCDINGSIEITRKSTMPDQACYTYYAESDSFVDQIEEEGVTVMAIDNLPCEFPRDASSSFSQELKCFVDGTCSANFKESFDKTTLPDAIKKATILYNGELTEEFEYIQQFL
jgi:alanine dehydrogenase